jgi:arylsulfatase A-like enzyme
MALIRLIPAWIVLLGALSPAWAAADRPHVLFLLADDMRPDAFGAAGNPHLLTPHLDRLAQRGQRFTRAIANNPLCVPSRAEILTGCSGFANGVLPGYSNRLDPALVTWPQAMAAAGYRTAFVGKWHIEGRPSDRGYTETDGLYSGGGGKSPATHTVDAYGRPITGYSGWVFQSADGKTKHPDKGVGLTADISREFADAAIRLIRAPSDKPLFIHVNFTAPHDPLLWPPGFENAYPPDSIPLPANFLPQHPFDHGNLRGRDEVFLPFPRTEREVKRELALYYAVISHMDQQIGRILDALQHAGKLDNTLVVFTADHGMAKGSHGLTGKQNMYEHTVNVPMILAGPGVTPGLVRSAQVQLSDLYPTVCEMAGVPIPPTVQARSFASVLRGQSDSLRSEVFGYFMGYQRMVRGERFKLIVYPHLNKDQLFDLQEDPNETRDLAADPAHEPIRAGLRAKLLSWQRQVKDPVLEGNFGQPRR